MNLEALAVDVIRPALQKQKLVWHGWHAFRPGLATNLHRLGVSDKVIQQILRHANVSTTLNIYVKALSVDAANAMRTLETMRANTMQPARLGSTRIMRSFYGRKSASLDAGSSCGNLAERGIEAYAVEREVKGW